MLARRGVRETEPRAFDTLVVLLVALAEEDGRAPRLGALARGQGQAEHLLLKRRVVFEQQEVFERAAERHLRRVDFDLAEPREVERLLPHLLVLAREAFLDVLHRARPRTREVADLFERNAREAARLRARVRRLSQKPPRRVRVFEWNLPAEGRRRVLVRPRRLGLLEVRAQLSGRGVAEEGAAVVEGARAERAAEVGAFVLPLEAERGGDLVKILADGREVEARAHLFGEERDHRL